MLLILLMLPALGFTSEPDLNALLKRYKNAADLSQKTKKESAGNLIIFTRTDLERMQVRYLYELIKRLPFINYREGFRGYANSFYENIQPAHSGKLKIFLNDHEISTAYYGDNMGLISHMELSLIDHVEVYQGYPSFELSIEPTLAIIRLYSKDPAREQGGRISVERSSLGGYSGSAAYADNVKGVAYYAHVSNARIKREKTKLNGHLLSKDQSNSNVYFSAETDNHRVEFQALQKQHDDFMGHSADGTPEQAQSNADFYRLGWRSYFSKKSLELQLSLSKLNSLSQEKDSTYLTIFPYFPKEYREDLSENIISGVLKKRFLFAKHDLLFGLQFKEKRFKFKTRLFNHTAIPSTWPVTASSWRINAVLPFNNEQTKGIFVEDSFQVTARQRLIASGKYAEVNRNATLHDDKLSALRWGYIFSTKNYDAKLFHTRLGMPIVPYLLQGGLGNANLKHETLATTTLELKQQGKKLSSNTVIYYAEAKNTAYYDFSKTVDSYINFDGSIFSTGLYTRLRYKTTPLNYLELAAYYRRDDITLLERFDVHQGGHLRYVGSHNAWDLFAEVVWYKLSVEVNYDYFQPVSKGVSFDLGFATTYHLSQDLALVLKGENLLDKAAANNHIAIDIFAPQGSNFTKVSNVSSLSRQLWFSLEYLF